MDKKSIDTFLTRRLGDPSGWGRPPMVSDEELISTVNRSESLESVAKQLGYSKSYVRVRVSKLRAKLRRERG